MANTKSKHGRPPHRNVKSRARTKRMARIKKLKVKYPQRYTLPKTQ